MKVGILGSGVISRTYLADIQAFYKELEVAAVGDIDLSLAQKLAGEFNVPKAYVTEDLLKDEEIELIINLTPPQFHVQLAKQILSAGKHLFSEKPFAPTLEEAREVFSLAKEKGLRVGSAPDTFLSSGIQSARFYLDSGLIGKPFFVTMNMTTFGVETWHPNPVPFYKKGSGPLYDMAPYYLSALVTLLGPIETIGALSASGLETRHVYIGKMAGSEIVPEVPTHYTAILRMKSGAVVNFNISYDIYRSNLPMFEIYGDGGTLTYPDPNFGGGTPTVYRKEQYTDVIYQDTPEAAERREKFYPLPELYTRAKDYSRGLGVLDLVQSIREGRPNRAGESLILHITEAIEGMLKSAQGGAFYRMETACERPEPLTPGSRLDET